ncbi:TrbL/VirB6 family protein, partial [Anaplasma bovis]|uniref:type IV secretion system protein n=1 Tax=Anaplasma bovis TaxID=186733 RepID=UPI002FEF0E4C
MFRLILFLCAIVLTSCGGRCIEPGGGSSSGSIEVVVPVLPEGADRKNPATYWINSGQKVEKGKELKITVERTINFCPKDSSAPVTVRMFDDQLKSDQWYYPVHMNVVAGDQVSFSPVLYDVEVTRCDDITSGNKRILYYGNSEFYKDEKGKDAVSATTLCANGGGVGFSQTSNHAEGNGATGGNSTIILPPLEYLYIKGKSGNYEQLPSGVTIPRIAGSVIKTPRLEYPIGYFGHVNLGNDYSNLTDPAKVVVNGILHDARTVRSKQSSPLNEKACSALKKHYKIRSKLSNFESVNQLISSSSAKKEIIKYEEVPTTTTATPQQSQGAGGDAQEEKALVEEILREYTEYDINCNCKRICDPTQRVNEENCIRSIVLVDSNKLVCPTNPDYSTHAVQTSDYKNFSQDLLGTNDNGDLQKKVSGKIKSAIKSRINTNTTNLHYELAEGVSAWVVTEKFHHSQARQGRLQYIAGRVHNYKNIRNIADIGTKNFIDTSLEMHKGYPVLRSGLLYLSYSFPSGTVSQNLKAENAYGTKGIKGYYALNVYRTCYASDGKDLYIHVGNSAPDYLPGDKQNEGKKSSPPAARTLKAGQIEFKNSESKWNEIPTYEGYATINEGNKGDSEGTVYFGIKVDESYEAQLKEYGNEDNYYLTRLWVPTSSPVFSKFFAYLQGSLLHVLYGTEVPILGKDSQIGKDVSHSIRQALSGKPSASPDRKQMGAVQQIYNNQVASKPFWSAVMALLTLYLIFTVLGYILGVTQLTKYDLMIRLSKVTMILVLISPNSWDFFYNHCFSIFVAGIPEVITAFNGYLGGDTSFAFLDSTLGVMFSSDVWLRMLSLIMAGPVGWIIMIAVMWAMIVFFVAVLKAVLKYLLVTLTLAFLVTLAPIFITFLLFQFTRGVFDAWLRMIVNFSLQPIILFAALAFLNQVILSSLYTVTNFTACETCALGIDIPSDDPESPNRKDICIIPALLPVGFTNELSVEDRMREDAARADQGFMGLPFGVTVTMILILACLAVKEFANIADVMAHSISGSVAGITASAMGATQALLGVVGLDDATQNLIRQARGMTPVGDEKVRFEADNNNVTPRHDSTRIDHPVPRDDNVASSPAPRDNYGASPEIKEVRRGDPEVDVVAGYSGSTGQGRELSEASAGHSGVDDGRYMASQHADSQARTENTYETLGGDVSSESYSSSESSGSDSDYDDISSASYEDCLSEEVRNQDQLGDGFMDYAAAQESMEHNVEHLDVDESDISPEQRVENYDSYTGEEGAVGGDYDISPEQRVENYDSYTGEEGAVGGDYDISPEQRVESY